MPVASRQTQMRRGIKDW